MSTHDEPLEEIRAALRARTEETSLRAVARDVGLSPSGFRRLLAGTAPLETTRYRMRAWHAAQCADPPPLDDEARDALLAALTRHLPADRRQAAIAEVVFVLEAAAG